MTLNACPVHEIYKYLYYRFCVLTPFSYVSDQVVVLSIIGSRVLYCTLYSIHV